VSEVIRPDHEFFKSDTTDMTDVRSQRRRRELKSDLARVVCVLNMTDCELEMATHNITDFFPGTSKREFFPPDELFLGQEIRAQGSPPT